MKILLTAFDFLFVIVMTMMVANVVPDWAKHY